MVHALLEKKDLDSEMTVVRNEMERDQNSPVQVLAQTMRSAAYQWHNYGHSTMGARSDIENVNVAQLRAFYTRYYQPDNAVLIVAGKFNPEHTRTAIASHFLTIPTTARDLPPEPTVQPVHNKEREMTQRRHVARPPT